MRILKPCLIMLGTLVWPSMGLADISFNNGVWVTSFDYGQECSGDGCNLISDDSVGWNAGPGTNGGPDQSGKETEGVVAANNPDGAGGLGARFWIGRNSKDQNTKPNRISFPTQEKEIWVRWYMRYEQGFDYGGSGPGYDKWLYMRAPDQSTRWIIPQPAQGAFRVATSGPDSHPINNNINWTDVFGITSDGLFHMIEVHIKIDTDSTNGVIQMWVDGNKIIDVDDMDISGGDPSARLGIKYFDFVSNQSPPQNASVMYVDFDDIEIWKTTPPNISPNGDPWIGPLNGFSGAGSLPKPKSPAPVGVSFYNPIEDSNITSRGWFDKTSMVLANSGATSGSTKSIDYRFNSGATQALR